MLAREVEEHREVLQLLRYGALESLGPLFEMPPDRRQVGRLPGTVESQ